MNSRDRAIADVEAGVMSVELDTQVLFPEIPAPAVMVSAYHDNRQSAAKPSQRCRDVKATPRNHPAVGEPEVEQVPIDEQAVTQGGHHLQKFEETLFYLRWCYAEVGVGNDDKTLTQHGAKDGGLPATGPEPAEAAAKQGMP